MDATHRATTLRASLNRRTFLLGGAAATLAACSSGTSTTQPRDLSAPVTLPPDGPPFPVNQTSLGARFPDGIRAPTAFVEGVEARLPFVALDAEQLPLTADAPSSLDVVVQRNGVVVHEQTVPAEAQGEFTPYFPVVFTPEVAGQYVVVSDYGEVESWFGVVERDQVSVPQIGDALPPFATPTFDNPEGVELLCTRQPDPCPFHEAQLDLALGEGRPVAFLIATPLFCQTDVCGPSVDYLVELAPQFPDITFLHSEVWAEDINSGEPGALPPLAPVVQEYMMPWEPALFVADGTGTIVAALHFAMSKDEVAAALAKV